MKKIASIAAALRSPLPSGSQPDPPRHRRSRGRFMKRSSIAASSRRTGTCTSSITPVQRLAGSRRIRGSTTIRRSPPTGAGSFSLPSVTAAPISTRSTFRIPRCQGSSRRALRWKMRRLFPPMDVDCSSSARRVAIPISG